MGCSMSDRGIADLVADEGEVLTTYRCPAGMLTIGVGPRRLVSWTRNRGKRSPRPKAAYCSRLRCRVIMTRA